MNKDIIIKIYKRTLIASFFIVGICFFLFKEPKPIILGYIFGVIISMLGFKLLDNTINRAVKMAPNRANAYTVMHYVLRNTIYFIVLSISAIAGYLNFPATILGLLMIKFVIIISSIVDKNFTK
ncbi:MAG: ATP synthase subunit I [Tissierellaceae bacterium]